MISELAIGLAIEF